MKISEEERQRRIEAAAMGRASVALEGLIVSPEAEALFQKYIDGELTIEECIELLKQRARA